MSREELAKNVEALHQELAQHPQLDEATIRSMRELLSQIQVALAEAGKVRDNEPPGESPFSDRLQEFIAGFEARHPQLTMTLSQIADRLTDMGI